MLETAVLSHIDNFNAQLQTYFDDMSVKGREITVEIPIAENSSYKAHTERTK